MMIANFPKWALLLLLLTHTLGMSSVAIAEPLEEAKAAIKRGDVATALHVWRALADQGNAEAQLNLGLMYDVGQDVPQDFAEAAKWYRAAAEQGHAQAQVLLAALYDEGQGVTQSDTEAARWLRLAANQGNARAQVLLGLKYEHGRGVARNLAEAAMWYFLAAEQGHSDAQFNLAQMYREGRGLVKDLPEAARLYRLAAGQGDASAQFHLALMYDRGDGVTQNYLEAAKWYRRSALQGEKSAQNNLGLLFLHGQGVDQDNVEAHKWFNLAAIAGDQKAAGNRRDVERNMAREQIVEAQRLADACRASNYKQCGPGLGDILANRYGSAASPITPIPLRKEGGTFVVPVHINDAITLNFILDSGAADVSVPADVVSTLMRTGTVKSSDFRGKKTYVLADGSKLPSETFRIRRMKIGNRVVENVMASVAPVKGNLLLGQSFLGRFKSWSIDNAKQALFLE